MTDWFLPHTISQHSDVEQYIPWKDNGTGFAAIKTTDYGFVNTESTLYHIANPSVNDRRIKTWFLYLTDFRFEGLPDSIQGIEAEISSDRRGRVTDDTIQLLYNGEFIGRNLADARLDPLKTVGSPSDLWNVDTITSAMLLDPSFGIGIRFQSHPSWPHRDTANLSYLRMRIW